MPQGTLITFALIAMLLFVIYRRVRRNIGRQRLRPVRIVIVVALLTFVFLILLLIPRTPLPVKLGGALVGAVLALLGLRLTRFERDDDGAFYTPNTYIGLTLLALFVGRMAYRSVFAWRTIAAGDSTDVTSVEQAVAGGPAAGISSSALTMGIVFVLLGYYVFYYLGILLRHVRPS